MGSTLDLLTGKDCSVDGLWLGVVEGVSISYEEDRLKCRLDILIDNDGLDRLKEYAKITEIFGGQDNEKDSRQDDGHDNKGTH